MKAYRLGEENVVIRQLMEEGKVKKRNEEEYEIFSREAIHGKGELAHKGDYVRVDSEGFPYPNAKEFVQKNMRHIMGDDFEQIPQICFAWSVKEPMCDEVSFLIQYKNLMIDEAHEETYFTAPLWGTKLSAAKDAVIVFYAIDYDAEGKILDADFNFVAYQEFVKTYDIIFS